MATELDQLDVLGRMRTPGKIVADENALHFGTYRVYGFEHPADAQYLAQAANTLPKLLSQLLNAHEGLHDQAQRIKELETQLAQLQAQVLEVTAQNQVVERQLTVTRERLLERSKALRAAQASDKPKQKVQVKRVIRKVTRFQVVDVPRRWLASDGHIYQLIFAPDQAEGDNDLDAQPDLSAEI